MFYFNVVESEKIGAIVFGIRAGSEKDAIDKVYQLTGYRCLFAFKSAYGGRNLTNRIEL